MQFINALLVAGASVASAAAVPRQTTQQPQEFNITAFSFSGTPHSVVAYYGLNVTKADGSSPEIECGTSTNTSPSISAFPLTICSQPDYSFGFAATNTSQGSGYSLKVTHSTGVYGAKNETGCVFIPDSDVLLRENPAGPTGNVYYVSYGPDFQLTYSEMDECIYA